MKAQCYGCKSHKDKIGVLIGQLGTPKSPTAKDLKPYLKRFLGDPRVIEKPRLLWWFILNFLILTTRPKRSAELYKRIWRKDGSPLEVFTKEFTDKVRNFLQEESEDIEVEYGNRYSSPSLEDAVDRLIEKGCSKILLFNLYPQYSSTTSATNYDVVFSHLLKRRVVPTLRIAEPYFANPNYISATASVINKSLSSLETPVEKLVFSYHGIPAEYVEKGDTYCCQCAETSDVLVPELEYPTENIIHTYQSRFGKDPWLQPYTDYTIVDLAKAGVKRIAVACPGFTTDCLETLDEIGNEAREEFQEHGGESLHLIPCLNSDPAWIEGASKIILSEIGSWLDTAARSAARSSKIACPNKIAVNS